MAKTKGKGGIALPLKYHGSTVFRVEKDFVAQMGDITRQDGSGGESICKPTASPRGLGF